MLLGGVTIRDFVEWYDQYISGNTADNFQRFDVSRSLKILELPHDAKDLKVIKAQYKKLAKLHHPDIGGSSAKMSELNKAYQILENNFNT